ncbi:MAG TPA: hypothetical protein VIA45_00405 [Thermoanaerobaculia bacterium]|jgi:hypothetical protein
MTPSGHSSLHVGQVLEIELPRFVPRITFNSERELTVEIISGDNAGFTDTVEYEAVPLRDGFVLLSWQEHIGSTIVHVIDLKANHARTFVTPAQGGFLRMSGRIAFKSER